MFHAIANTARTNTGATDTSGTDAGVAVRAVRLPRDNHWTMPASADFLAALRAELPALERQSKK